MMSEGMQTEGQYDCATCGEGLNIIGILQHDCDTILGAESLTNGERNTLMYVEQRVVDHEGELDLKQMNYHDQQNLKLFGAAGILDAEESGIPHEETMQVVEFTDRAWDLVRDCRQMRAAQRMDPEAIGLEGDG